MKTCLTFASKFNIKIKEKKCQHTCMLYNYKITLSWTGFPKW